MTQTGSEPASCTIKSANGGTVVVAGGAWIARTITPVDREMRQLAQKADTAERRHRLWDWVATTAGVKPEISTPVAPQQ